MGKPSKKNLSDLKKDLKTLKKDEMKKVIGGKKNRPPRRGSTGLITQ